MRATGWHNGGKPDEADGYGIKLTPSDRDRYFNREWAEVVLELGDVQATVALAPSFWRSCSELRSPVIGQWLLGIGEAPWHKGQPPGIVVRPLEDNRFSASLLKRHNLLS